MATQADQTVLGNVSGGSAVPTAVPIVGAAGILVNNDSLGTDDTKGATQGNIKAYVDGGGGFTPTSYTGGNEFKLPNGLIMKFGTAVSNSDNTQSFTFASNGSSSFPNAGIHIVASGIPSVTHTVDKDGFSIDRFSFVDGSITFPWLAIGY